MCTPPKQAAAFVRPVRPPPKLVGCALPTPTVARGPFRELQETIGARPAAMESLLRRKLFARDLRIDPMMYNWLVFGVMPGAAHHPFSLLAVRTDNSDVQDPVQG